MKKLKPIVGLFLLAILSFISCQKDSFDSNVNPINNVTEEDIYYDVNVTGRTIDYDESGKILQQSIAYAVQNLDLKKHIFQQALLREDGDTEFLLSSILDKTIDNSTVLEYLVKSYNEHSNKKSITEELIHTIVEEFPAMMIGVRGHGEDVNLEEFTPNVVFMSSTFSAEDETIMGMNFEKKETIYSLKESPDEIVLVVHLSERHDKFGNLIEIEHTPSLSKESVVDINEVSTHFNNKSVEPAECVPLAAPYGLIAFVTPEGNVRLSWQGNIDPSTCGAYKIFRDGVQVGQRGPGDQLVWTDTSVEPNQSYTYQVRFSYLSLEGWCISDWSNFAFATTPEIIIEPQNKPLPPSNFWVTNHIGLRNQTIPGNDGLLNYTWQQPSGDYTGFLIEKYNWETTSWEIMEELPSSAIDFDLRYPFGDANTRYWTRIRTVNKTNDAPNDLSDPVYDIIYPAFRSSGDPLKLHGFKIPNLVGIEPWTLGRPEFRIYATIGRITEGGPAGSLEIDGALVSLWEANEATTESILIAFYKNLKTGQNKDEALRNAKIKFINTTSSATKQPFYWANFIHIGNDNSIDIKKDNFLNYKILGGSLFVILFLIFARRFFKN